MQIDYLSLVNFRNYTGSEFLFEPGFNLLLGQNGQGKTNAVESIIFLANQNSHRTSDQKAMIQKGRDSTIIRSKLSNVSREALIESKLNAKGPNQYFLNKRKVSGKEIQQILQAVIFAPEDLQIVRGDPATRRTFVDQVLVSRYPIAATVLSDYDRAIKQKNTLLKSARISGHIDAIDSTLSVWNEKIVDLGSQITFYRFKVIRDLKPLLKGSYHQISGINADIEVSLKSSVLNVSRETLRDTSIENVSRETISTDLQWALDLVREEEFERAQSLVGPHRDDLEFELNNLPVKGYASHGETWSFVLSLKLAVARLLAEDSSYGDPIIILDDVFAELDRNRQSRLVSEISKFQQVIVTAAVAEDVPSNVEKKIFHIDSGQVI